MKFKINSSARLNANRINKNIDNRKTLALGVAVVTALLLIVFFGFSFLINFSSFLGGQKDETNTKDIGNKLPPLPPRIFIPFEATNSAVLEVAGTAETGTLIELVKDDVLLDTLNVDDDGDFVFENILLSKGENIFSAVAISKDGVRSDSSSDLLVIFDDEPPSLTMTNPSEESLTVEYEDYDVRGIVEIGTSVTINGKIALIDSVGNFKLKLQLNPGKNSIEVRVKDLAGNEVLKNIEITYDF